MKIIDREGMMESSKNNSMDSAVRGVDDAVVVWVTGGSGGGGRRSRRAVLWAVENLLAEESPRRHLLLIHVIPAVTAIPTPLGDQMPIQQVPSDLVDMYMQDLKSKSEEIFLPYKRLCKTHMIKTLVLDDDNPVAALQRYISDSGIGNMVVGYPSMSWIMRCISPVDEKWSKYVWSSPCTLTQLHRLKKSGQSHNHLIFSNNGFRNSGGEACHTETNHCYLEGRTSEIQSNQDHNSVPPIEENSSLLLDTSNNPEEAQDEVAVLRQELQNILVQYNQACEDLVYARNKVRKLSAECSEESKKVKDALEREEMSKKIAAEEKSKLREAVKEAEIARQLLVKEIFDRHKVEMHALVESSEKRKIVDALLYGDKRYKRYSTQEIELATDGFSEAKKIGEGGYGSVYKCHLDHTPVAVKVLHPEASDKKEEFLREVEILGRLRHPHMLLLLGACPENGCLVYEYMENGSLEDRLFCVDNSQPLPWFIRFRILFEVACGLAFLHGTKPDPIVHRDLKPGNILLDRNYVSKIGDVGLGKLMSHVVPDNVTEYRDTILAGTFFYMDPEYQRTGTLRPKSDLYAFGIIILQILTARRPAGLLVAVENALKVGCFTDVLDKSTTDWPLAEAERLAWIALKCTRLRCRDRPELESEVLPELERLARMADAYAKQRRTTFHIPNHYFCPILQEVMDDPYIAADGYTYECIAIKMWLEKHSISPVTKLGLPHTHISPNLSLRSAIQEWKAQAAFSVI
ncbi:U-box domain-containing protein 34 [Acorus calamus]|uniref:RING-type E3 ubiquitin transferase n=1 Tax=Acorus calamus TaxID=4465 RepID=A0AAV9CCU9_ACOCL|nr:U-box domain-containing protein 34 [Acorus calamus]